MNILILSHRVPFPPNKGEKIRTFHQVKHLSELGHQVHLFAPSENTLEDNHFQQLNDSYCTTVNTHYLPGKPARLLAGLIKNKPMSVANFYISALQQQFDEFIQNQKVDVVLCTASSMAEYVFNSKTLTGLTKKPVLLMDFMDVDSDKWGQYASNTAYPTKWIYNREQRLLAEYERQILAKFDRCYLIAQAEVDLFSQKVDSSKPVTVMGNGLDMAQFYPPITAPSNIPPVFLFTGVMDYKPNIDAVLWFVEHCWSEILELHPDARFIVAGMNPNTEVQKLTETAGIEVTGFVEDILPYYHQANIFIAPFRLARGVQNKVLQAFSCGIPVVSTPMGAEGICCAEEHDILLANQPEEFIQQINRILQSPELTDKLRTNALQLIKDHYSWESQLQPLDEVLKREVGFK